LASLLGLIDALGARVDRAMGDARVAELRAEESRLIECHVETVLGAVLARGAVAPPERAGDDQRLLGRQEQVAVDLGESGVHEPGFERVRR
jgi:hypothetical protein